MTANMLSTKAMPKKPIVISPSELARLVDIEGHYLRMDMDNIIEWVWIDEQYARLDEHFGVEPSRTDAA